MIVQPPPHAIQCLADLYGRCEIVRCCLCGERVRLCLAECTCAPFAWPQQLERRLFVCVGCGGKPWPTERLASGGDW